jgi:uncharacterized membrane protein
MGTVVDLHPLLRHAVGEHHAHPSRWRRWLQQPLALTEVRAMEIESACWEMRRACRLTPRQVLAGYAATGVVQAAISLPFLASGFPWIALFAAAEWLAIGAALLVHARHTGDREVLRLSGGRLYIEQRHGGRICTQEWPAAWVRVKLGTAPGALVELRSGRGHVRLGTHLRPQQRAALAQELQALLQSR